MADTAPDFFDDDTFDAVISREDIQKLPKVLLHDHLDGGLRAETLIELAEQYGYTGLPSTDPDELRKIFVANANSGSLEKYLEAFAHTTAVMQTPEALTRIVNDMFDDYAADNIYYAEVRFAPGLHTRNGMSVDEVIRVVNDAVEHNHTHRHADKPLLVKILICGMRQDPADVEASAKATIRAMRGVVNPSLDATDLLLVGPKSTRAESGDTVEGLDESLICQHVVGFDLAGPENGFPPSLHHDALTLLNAFHIPLTIHAGEAAGLESIAEAIRYGARRIGHGTRLIDDVDQAGIEQLRSEESDEDPARAGYLGALASVVRDTGVCLEMCPTSNSQTGAIASVEEHPLDVFRGLDFMACLNTDNRLVSGVSLTDEYETMAKLHGFDAIHLMWLGLNALESSFLDLPSRVKLMAAIEYDTFQIFDSEPDWD